MDDTRLTRMAGICAVIGGAAWTAASIIHASQPRGCVGDECDHLPMRNTTTATDVLLGLAAVMMVASGAGLLVLVRRHGRMGRAGVAGALACALGLALLAVASAIQALFYDGDFPLMPGFVLPGVAALVVG